ncbi:geraniol 8-hydroxylase-like protein [Cinnamomum micranthum f. kanehirae]|uniref:Geraniol 8-hydroxylase-like protein n=1 Tax=Cinnamomum micranthum f. kanehirae TaxID=337451 RepID=A0A443NQC5_9MAGN|nr:geraniol 8-hydroxylase-like protein [Cinnamomum micranthum f. kanehirae]
MDFSTLLVCASCLWVLFQALQMARNKSSTAKLPPGPVPLPVVGSLFKIGDKPNESLAELARTYGPLMTLRLGQVTTIVASSSTMAKEILQKQDHLLAGRTVVDSVCTLDYNDSAMAFSQPNQHWRRLRAVCNTQIFTTQKLDSYQGLRRLKVQELLAHMREKSQMGQPVEIVEAVFVTTLNLISNTVFSVDLVGLNTESAQRFNRLIWGMMEEVGRPNLTDYFPILRPIDPQGARRRMTAYFKQLLALFDEMIDDRLSSSVSPKKNDFLDALLEETQGGGLTRHHVKCLLMDVFSAGSETSASTVEWAMVELLRHPKVMEKARSELIETIKEGRPVEESDISRLPYLQAVLKETFRLHPPAPLLLPHRAESDVEIGGFTIPKDAKVLVNVWAIGRDSNTWVDPTSFMPERFLGSNVDYKGRDFELLPFGAGRRICPGLPLASRMVHLMLASLLRSFAWKLPDGMAPQDIDMSHKFGLTLRKQVPLLAVPILPQD